MERNENVIGFSMDGGEPRIRMTFSENAVNIYFFIIDVNDMDSLKRHIDVLEATGRIAYCNKELLYGGILSVLFNPLIPCQCGKDRSETIAELAAAIVGSYYKHPRKKDDPRNKI